MVDELWSGVAVVAAPEVETFHEVSHAQYTLWVFAVPILLASLIEAPIALVSDRLPRRRLLASGLAALALSLALAACATAPWFLAVALSLAGAASGVACDSAQAELITRHPGGAAPAMTRWLAFAAAGDALVPLVIAGIYALGGTHRSALSLCALVLGAQALLTYRGTARTRPSTRQPLDRASATHTASPKALALQHTDRASATHTASPKPDPTREHTDRASATHAASPEAAPTREQAVLVAEPTAQPSASGADEAAADPRPSAADRTDTDTDEEEAAPLPLRAALAEAARKPRLWLFLFGASACTLLDEVVVALGALRLTHDLGWSESEAALVMTGLSSGAVLGALVSERLLQTMSSRRLLVYAAAGSCILLALVVAADSAPVIALALFCLGITCALHWPLVKAAAYELVPGQPGVVNALQQAFVGMDIALPLLVGVIASRFGLAAALASLALEPIILLIVACFWRASTKTSRTG